MPASTLDPVNAALRTSLSKTNCNSLDAQLAGATKKALLSNIEFEAAGSYQSSVLDKLKSKYIVLKSSETIETSNKPKQKTTEKMGVEDGLTVAKLELFPLKSVQLGWNNADWSVGAGMVNMGNTCYLNSTLQALFHVPALVNWLISDKLHIIKCEESGGSLCVICAMRKTLQDSQQRSVSSIRPYLIYNKLRLLCRNLLPGRQEDAHEFLRYLVEAMEKAYLSRFKNHTEFDSRTKETTPLNQILGGYLRSAVRCLECGNVSTTFQHFQDVLLDIRKAQTLDEALDLYFSREKLDDDSYHCESCQKKVTASKQFSMERAPMVLCLQLKRFSISNNKITKHVQFRQRLDLTKYMRKRPANSLVYKLVALVTHMGPTVNCGHYTAIAQAPSGNFYQFDDSIVKPISHQAVFSTNAYIMLYELENASMIQINGKAKISTITDEKPTSTTSLNGNLKVYGPSLPPGKFQKPLSLTQNGLFSLNGNGDNHSPEPKASSTLTSSNQSQRTPVSSSSITSTSETPASSTTKLVPYDMDDSSDCSEESHNNAGAPPDCSKVALGDWRVSSTTDNAEPSSEGSTWDKTKGNDVSELLRMSHSGYGAPVSTWNGTRSLVEKEVNNERREERKRALVDNTNQGGRVKHPKLTTNGNGGHNPTYNPVQEYHNSKNWNPSNGPPQQRYRMFYNSGKRHRNDRRNYHHKNYHKGHRFRH